jgi:hypothetical protein
MNSGATLSANRNGLGEARFHPFASPRRLRERTGEIDFAAVMSVRFDGLGADAAQLARAPELLSEGCQLS